MKANKAAEEYLNSFINYEKKTRFSYKRSLKLERVKILFHALQIPYKKLKVIHIAGTKGKGSTAVFCANLLASAGYKVGLYTSPHFFSFRERIKIVCLKNKKNKGIEFKNQAITEAELDRILEKIRPFLEGWRVTPLEKTADFNPVRKYLFNGVREQSSLSGSVEKLGKLTFFEVYTAIAFKYFVEKNVDFVVLETGLGGRLDATNIVNPLVCIITHIGYDHTDKLGNKLKDIAYEKAGIIKSRIPVILPFQRKSALRVIKKKCMEKKAPGFFLGRHFKAENIRIRKNCTFFDFKFRNFKLRNLKIRLRGKCQIENACCGLTAVFLLKETGAIEDKIGFKKSVYDCFLAGRFETIKKDPLTILDIAHNVSSVSVLRDNLELYYPSKKIILIFACSKDKDAKKILKKINYSYLILTRFHNLRSYDPWEIKKICNLKQVFIAKDIKEAIEAAKKVYKRNSIIVVSGSMFLVSEAKKLSCLR